MKYFSEHKDLMYHLKSGLITFLSGFGLIFSMEVWNAYHSQILTLKPEDITVASIIGILFALARIAVIALAKALFNLLMNLKKK